MTIFGVKFPQDRPVDNLAALALVSIPMALIAATGYGIFLGAQAVLRRMRRESNEERCQRMERVSRLGSALELEP